MKNYLYKSVLFIACAGILAGCAEDLPGTALVVNYPLFVLEGEESMIIESGNTYTEPGVTATEDGVELPVETSISGTYFYGNVATIDASKPDIYHVTYSAENSLGYAGSATRTVTVLPPSGDLVNSIEGVYTSTVVRDVGGGGPDYTDMEYIIITKIGPDKYQLSDGIGGYYDFGRDYGSAYAATGATVTANNIATDDFTFNTFPVGIFGGEAEIISMSVNPASKKIIFTTTWDSGYVFDITLTQVEL